MGELLIEVSIGRSVDIILFGVVSACIIQNLGDFLSD
jgi:hypothetical protein